MLENTKPIPLLPSFPPTLVVVVDTEEEFDWYGEFRRESTSIKAVHHIDLLQQVFDEFAIRPVYVMDYPIASQADGVQAFKPILDDGRAEIGAHLHAWVTPPYIEKVGRRNSYQKNLPPDVESDKLRVLKAVIEDSFSTAVTVHKAGRYGIGESTPATLLELGFDIDISVVPGFDYSADGGPDFSELGSSVFRFGPENRLLGIPNTGAFIGKLASHGPALYRADRQSKRHNMFLSRLLSRSRLVERIMLSPEGHTISKLIRLTEALRAMGESVFTFSLHSPTVMPGGTPYASSKKDVDDFLDKCRRYFDYFINELGGRNLTPTALKSAVEDVGSLGGASEWRTDSK